MVARMIGRLRGEDFRTNGGGPSLPSSVVDVFADGFHRLLFVFGFCDGVDAVGFRDGFLHDALDRGVLSRRVHHFLRRAVEVGRRDGGNQSGEVLLEVRDSLQMQHQHSAAKESIQREMNKILVFSAYLALLHFFYKNFFFFGQALMFLLFFFFAI